MLKILLPVDFSEGTYSACQYALQFSGPAAGTQLMLLHCFQDYLADADTDAAPADQTPSAAIAENIIHRNETDAFAQLEALYTKLQEHLSNDSNMYLERMIVHGSPEDCIPEQVNQFQADLLVMHTDGQSGLARSIFGTITTKMVEKVKIPVLTVPQHNKGTGMNRVLYATDFDKADVQALQQLHRLLQPASPDILCVHIATDEAPKAEAQLRVLQEQLPAQQSSRLQFVLLQGDDVAAALLEFVQREQIDLVSLASREQSSWAALFNQSLAKKLVLESQVPLLIFHGQD